MSVEQKLDLILTKLDEQGAILQEHTAILKEHSAVLQEHTTILKEHSAILQEHTATLTEHSQTLKNHEAKLDEHGKLLSALLHGQEMLKAEFEGAKLESAKQFGEVKESQKRSEDGEEILFRKLYANEKDIHRLKKIAGIE